MFLSLTLCCPAGGSARDLGFILYKHPDRVHTAELPIGTARVFFPRADDEVCTAALWVAVADEKLQALAAFRRDSFDLSGYINDRPWAASSLLAVALRRVFSTALNGTLKSRPELAETVFELEAEIAAVQTDAHTAAEAFAPLGWEVTTASGPDGLAPNIRLRGRARVQTLLSQLYVLIPVLDGGKHYWVDETEIDKLIAHAGTWLADHPARESIMRRYLAEQARYVRSASARLHSPAPEAALTSGTQGTDASGTAAGTQGTSTEATGASGTAADTQGTRTEGTGASGTAAGAPDGRQALRALRRDRVLAEITALRARSVVDIGCGAGALLAPLLADPRIASVIGTDVAADELARAERALHLDRMPERQAARLQLLHSSLTYVDERIAGADVAVLMEVIEHLDAERLPAAEASLFGHAAPSHVIVTTPNREYNVCYPGLAAGSLRHPDHRFEFTRAEFAAWAAAVCERYGYVVDIDGIGDSDPAHGQPTQIAVFSRSFDAPAGTPAHDPHGTPAQHLHGSAAHHLNGSTEAGR